MKIVFAVSLAGRLLRLVHVHHLQKEFGGTSRAHADAAEAAARDAGLRNVRVGSRHLLSAH